MPTIRTWLKVARLPSILLAICAVTMGSVIAFMEGKWHSWISLWAGITASLLQIIANLANDYGDFVRGAGVGDRISQTSKDGITLNQLRRAVVGLVILTIFSGLFLLQIAHLSLFSFISFVLLGAVSIIAAIYYTMGPSPYAYLGLGDISVFLFFGLVGVLGTAYLHTKTWHISYLLPAITCGCLATAVLNLNNIRDIALDQQVHKMTVAVRLGRKLAIFYQWVLLIMSVVSITIFTIIHYHKVWQWLFIVAIPRLIQNGIMTMQLPVEQLDKVLQRLILNYLYLVLLFSLGVIVSVYY